MISWIRRLPGGVVLFVALNVANVSNYLFQVVMGRTLGLGRYGLLGSVVQLVNVITISSLALQTASAKAIASADGPRVPLEHAWHDPLTRAAVRWGAAVSVVLVLVAPLIALFLHSGIGPALVLPAVVVPAALLGIGQGRLQGLNALHAFAVLALMIAFLRLILGPLAVAAHTGVTGAGMALVVAGATGATWALWMTRRAGRVDVEAARGDIGRGAIAFVLFWLMASADIVVAQHFLSSHAASQYAAASVMGKAVIWLPTAVAIALFPRVAQQGGDTSAISSLLIKSLILTLGLAFVAVLGLAVLGPPIIPRLYGAKYVPAAAYAWQIGVACIPFALANLLIYYHLAVGEARLLAAMVVGVGAETAGIVLFHGSPSQIAVSLGIGGAALCAALMAIGLAFRSRPAAAVDGKPSTEAWATVPLAESERSLPPQR
jgi:O-antigen/teichoic acid export membrane protein